MELSDWILAALTVWVVFLSFATINGVARTQRSLVIAGNIIDDLKQRIADLEARR